MKAGDLPIPRSVAVDKSRFHSLTSEVWNGSQRLGMGRAPKRYSFQEGANPGKPALAGQWLSGSGKYTFS
jgi:hypothetical protein